MSGQRCQEDEDGGCCYEPAASSPMCFFVMLEARPAEHVQCTVCINYSAEV